MKINIVKLGALLVVASFLVSKPGSASQVPLTVNEKLLARAATRLIEAAANKHLNATTETCLATFIRISDSVAPEIANKYANTPGEALVAAVTSGLIGPVDVLLTYTNIDTPCVLFCTKGQAKNPVEVALEYAQYQPECCEKLLEHAANRLIEAAANKHLNATTETCLATFIRISDSVAPEIANKYANTPGEALGAAATSGCIGPVDVLLTYTNIDTPCVLFCTKGQPRNPVEVALEYAQYQPTRKAAIIQKLTNWLTGDDTADNNDDDVDGDDADAVPQGPAYGDL